MDARQGSILTVGRLTAQIKELLGGTFGDVWVEGEVFTVRRSAAGHVYLTLKDDRAQLRAILFRGVAKRLGVSPSQGMHVVARGRIDVYEPSGEYSLIIDKLLVGGRGELLAALERLKTKLHLEGLFDEGRKRSLPLVPKAIGVVTSPTGAAIRDMVRTIHDRYPARIVLAPSLVQGAGAAESIARGIELLSAIEAVEVIIIGRGGGSLEDLWAFNEEVLVRAVVASPVPVVSAVGHEVDVPLTDLAADVRATTPTAAGKIVVRYTADELRGHLDEVTDQLTRGMGRRLESARSRVEVLAHRLKSPHVMVDTGRLRLDEVAGRLSGAMDRHLVSLRHSLALISGRLAATHPKPGVQRRREMLLGLERRLARATGEHMERNRAHLQGLAKRVVSLDPRLGLARGFAIVRRRADGGIVHAADALSPGDSVDLELSRGSARCTVDEVTA